VTDQTFGDPTMRGYWDAARRHELVAQHCADCGAWQFYARPFCLSCWSDDVRWEVTGGVGSVYSRTTVHRKIVPHLDPPYVVGIVELDEGVRLLSNLVGDCPIGARVTVAWRERDDGLPPTSIFEALQ
jgi:uncharacterized protein